MGIFALAQPEVPDDFDYSLVPDEWDAVPDGAAIFASLPYEQEAPPGLAAAAAASKAGGRGGESMDDAGSGAQAEGPGPAAVDDGSSTEQQPAGAAGLEEALQQLADEVGAA